MVTVQVVSRMLQTKKAPVAGFDPVMSKPLKRKLKKVKDIKK